MTLCPYCRARPPVWDDGLCARCHWLVLAEVEAGLFELARWLVEHGAAA